MLLIGLVLFVSCTLYTAAVTLIHFLEYLVRYVPSAVNLDVRRSRQLPYNILLPVGSRYCTRYGTKYSGV